MKKTIILGLTPFFSFIVSAQYFYKDIIGTNETNQLISSYIENKVSGATATGFDGEGIKSSDFAEYHKMQKNKNVLIITTKNGNVFTNQYFYFNSNNLLTSVTDTSGGTISVTTYQYNAQNKLIQLSNKVTDADDSIFISETHVWLYNSAGQPERMLRIVNDTDTTEVTMTLDENGNVIEEQPFRKKVGGEKIYYYYDAQNRITDVVRFNEKAQRLLPDFMFEYDANNRLAQKITPLADRGLSYVYWRYVYNEKGLKIKEATFNKDKALTGKIEYSYNF